MRTSCCEELLRRQVRPETTSSYGFVPTRQRTYTVRVGRFYPTHALLGVLRLEQALRVPGVAWYDAFASISSDVRHPEEGVSQLVRSLVSSKEWNYRGTSSIELIIPDYIHWLPLTFRPFGVQHSALVCTAQSTTPSTLEGACPTECPTRTRT